MPRYFFNVHDGVSIPDEDGAILSGWKEAQQEAVRLAGALLQERAETVKLDEDWRMEVTDETGLILFRLDFNIGAAAAISMPKRDERGVAS